MSSDNTALKASQFFTRGWCQFESDPELLKWIESALPVARSAVAEPDNAKWLRCGETWFAGVNILPNASDGSLDRGSPLSGYAVDFITKVFGFAARKLPAGRQSTSGLTEFSWDKAQVSICYPGYPQPMATETDAAFKFRRDRDGAHVDGLLPEGPNRRRFLREWHGFILAIPLLDYDSDASPFVIWEGSHEVVREAFESLFKNRSPDEWTSIDVTDAYHAVRRKIFETCRRVEIVAKPGEAYLVHRLALHGVAPWKAAQDSDYKERMICYFRPETGAIEQWLNDP
jgi:hypothetical protein